MFTAKLLAFALLMACGASAQFASLGGNGQPGFARESPAFIGDCTATGFSPQTCTLNTVGATEIYVGVSEGSNELNCAVSSSPANTFSRTSTYNTFTNVQATAYYVHSPATSSSQTFTVSGCTLARATFTVIAVSGTFSGTKEGENGATSAGTGTSQSTGATGSLTGTPYEVCFSHIGLDTQPQTNFTINSSFALPIIGDLVPQPTADSYIFPASATALNPTWSWTPNMASAAVLIFCIK